MKILHIIAQKPGETGSGIFLKNLIKVGAKKSHEQYVIAGIAMGENKYFQAMPKGVQFCPVYFESKELPFSVVGMSDVMPYEATKYSEMTEDMMALWKRAFQIELEKAASFHPELIIMHHLWILATMVREAFPTTPMIGICHGTELRQMYKGNHKLNDYVLNGCRKIDRITALSPFQKRTIEKAYEIEEDRIFVTGAGFDEEIFFPSKEKATDGPIKIIYAGKLSSSKGVPDLISAVSRLPYEPSSIELILAGSGTGKDRETISDLIEECPFRVELLGSIPQKRLGEIFRECHIFVLSSFYEGLSLVTIEAIASGLHVVANNLPGMKEWIGTELEESGMIEYITMPELKGVDTPLGEELEDYHQRLMKGIIKQISRVKEGKPLPEAWNGFINKFSWNSVFESIENIYHNMNQDR